MIKSSLTDSTRLTMSLKANTAKNDNLAFKTAKMGKSGENKQDDPKLDFKAG